MIPAIGLLAKLTTCASGVTKFVTLDVAAKLEWLPTNAAHLAQAYELFLFLASNDERLAPWHIPRIDWNVRINASDDVQQEI